MPADSELEFHAKRLEEKIAKLKSGELSAELTKGDGRQETAIHRNEKHLIDVRKQIAASKPK